MAIIIVNFRGLLLYVIRPGQSYIVHRRGGSELSIKFVLSLWA